MTERKAWLDVAIIKCPRCGHFYADASWYVVEIGADIECGKCHENFNTKKHVVNRIMLEFLIDQEGKAQHAEIVKHV